MTFGMYKQEGYMCTYKEHCDSVILYGSKVTDCPNDLGREEVNAW